MLDLGITLVSLPRLDTRSRSKIGPDGGTHRLVNTLWFIYACIIHVSLHSKIRAEHEPHLHTKYAACVSYFKSCIPTCKNDQNLQKFTHLYGRGRPPFWISLPSVLCDIQARSRRFPVDCMFFDHTILFIDRCTVMLYTNALFRGWGLLLPKRQEIH